MFLFLHSATIQQFSLMLFCSAFLWLGVNMALAWGAVQQQVHNHSNTSTTTKRAISKKISTSTSKLKKKTITQFVLPDGEDLETAPNTIQTLPKNNLH